MICTVICIHRKQELITSKYGMNDFSDDKIYQFYKFVEVRKNHRYLAITDRTLHS